MKKIHGLLAILALVFMASSCEDKYPDVKDGVYAEIQTNKGTMFAELYYKDAPVSSANFVALAEGKHPLVNDSLKGKPFYDGLIFHRVIKDFMIQGGDITGTGSGDVGYKFDQEVSDSLKHDSKGILSMANAGPDTNGSQFFIMHKENPGLDMRYNVFGKVVKGLEVVDSIATTPVNGQKPVEDMIMQKISIIRKGKEARKWDAVKTFEDALSAAKAKREEAEKIATERKASAPANKAAKATDLAALKLKATKLPNSDVMVYVKKVGSGEKPADGVSVMMDYSGFFMDGTLFDSSVLEIAQKYDNVNERKAQMNAYAPMPVQYSSSVGMVQGFKDAMLSMNYGDEIVAFIPSDLAYGERGAGGVIPPNTDLVFEMKITK
ncbi:cyclophilin family peptidyl-prolyl cis-trans isomerase [Nonlabens xylanidelens]|uniref:peptidylprolyl isomerase n=1 Tax=Nonlabens xylanidelens TaxID=191564 RepID=A0A2S6IIM3_9FLAO|nr:peptidylprolyl isomerase [Nonlabens xylanidelens]PPK94048.1 cyclophilin family peptidyl-prolyl cis-trans isomerase [Nonlabens xylanidelens]PQJ22201.1 peptidylprolyl isomerase [Nonlabens xylanidelens]